MSNNSSTEKRCTKCHLTKPVEAFSKHKGTKDGYQSHCKACNAAYNTANAENIRAYRAANIEAIRARDRAYYATNADAKRNYRIATADIKRTYNYTYRAANPEKFLEYGRNHRAAHPDVYRAYTHRRRALIKGNGGKFTGNELKAMRLAQAGICAYCKGQHDPNLLTIDHIIPLKQGGPHEATNICLACGKCNKNKGNRTPEQWTDRWYERSADQAAIRPRNRK